MKNITVTVPDDVYRAARIRAAERGSSVSALVTEYLRSLSSGGGTEFARLEAQQRRIQREVGSSGPSIGSGATRSTIVRFVDTNVLLYAISRDPAEAAKARRANEILAAGDVGLSVQVLQEFYVQATRASRPDAITHEQAVGLIESWRRFPVQEIDDRVMDAAFGTRQRFGISYWDAAIIEAAGSWAAWWSCPKILTPTPTTTGSVSRTLSSTRSQETRLRAVGRSPGRTLARPAIWPSDFRRSLGEPAKIRSHGCVEWYDTGRAAPSLTP